jgi:ACR3 family arsenite transporter
MTRDNLERCQVWIYLGAVLGGLLFGKLQPDSAPVMEALLWPALAVLLYATFTQMPLARLPVVFKDIRFMAAALLGNFFVLPLIVWGLLWLVPDDNAIRLGLALVLLMPCTDWFITFTHQGGGDTHRAVASAPALLIIQILVLPVYLWLFLGEDFNDLLSTTHMGTVFVVILALPLALAFFTERLSVGARPVRALVVKLGWLPVPMLAFVIFLVAGSQIEAVEGSAPVLGKILLATVLFLVAAVVCALVLARLFALPIPQARTLLFTFSTRNSFVVLPFALALPSELGAAAIVIIFQSLVELFAMLLFLWLVPNSLLPMRSRINPI